MFWPKHLGVLSLLLEYMEDKTFKNCHKQIPGGMDLFWYPSEVSQNPLSFFWETLVLVSIAMPYNLPAREQERYQTGLTERWKDLVWYIGPQSNLIAWEEIMHK